MDQGALAAPATLFPELTRVASPATSVEELLPHKKKPRVGDKGKEKASLRSSSVWDDSNLALTRAQDFSKLTSSRSSLECVPTRW